MPWKDPNVRRIRQQEYRHRNRERVRATVRKAMRKFRGKKSSEELREEWRVAHQNRRTKNKEHMNAVRRAWYRRNRHKVIGWVLKRKFAIVGFDPDAWQQRFKFYGERCAYCLIQLTKESVTIDHVIPISVGGKGWASNLVPACISCNLAKRAKRILPLWLRKHT